MISSYDDLSASLKEADQDSLALSKELRSGELELVRETVRMLHYEIAIHTVEGLNRLADSLERLGRTYR